MQIAKLLRTLIAMTVILTIAGSLAYAGSQQGAVFNGLPVFALCGAIAFIIQWIAFIPAYKFQTEMFYDLTGSVTYLLVVTSAIVMSPEIDPRSLILAILVGVWAIRLGSFLFARINQDGSDSRFDEIKPNFGRFLVTWSLQGLWVFVTAAAALAAITTGSNQPIGWIGLSGIALWAAGFVIEVLADNQKSAFRGDPANNGKFIQSGLWAYSRHPNYFGEILLWVGVAVLAYPALQDWQLAALVSPLFVFLLLTKVSGIPLLEAKADKRWGDDPEYQAYKSSTPVLFPFLR